MITIFVPIVSGVYLFTALYLIKKSVQNDSQVNIKAMTLHATSFGLYMASVLLFIYVFVMDQYFKKISLETDLMC